MINFQKNEQFEKKISKFYGSKFAVSTDCCTHAIELCLRLKQPKKVTCPNHTYLSVPMTLEKLKIKWKFEKIKWKKYYFIGNTRIIDAAVFWKKNGYVKKSLMCLSFQKKKFLSLGKGGMILTDNYHDYRKLKKMSYDGRIDLSKTWVNQKNISTLGFHYYMTPETAQKGLSKFENMKNKYEKYKDYKLYPDLSKFKIFK